VETALGYRRGFFGLVVEGRDIEDTTGKGARRPLPEDAMEVERLVGTLDIERAGGVRWTIEEFNACAPRPLTQDALDRRRARRAELFRMWSAVAPGDSLELEWPSCKQSKACRTDAAFGQRTTAEQSKPSPLPAKSASRSPREKRRPAGGGRSVVERASC
jgi:hypothetical protein